MLDLIQECNNGLLLALRTFPEGNDTFADHAATFIEHAVLKAIAESRPSGE
jgi:DNA-directed RNA polymerase sigma subunit (sigma70/sigma32)